MQKRKRKKNFLVRHIGEGKKEDKKERISVLVQLNNLSEHSDALSNSVVIK